MAAQSSSSSPAQDHKTNEEKKTNVHKPAVCLVLDAPLLLTVIAPVGSILDQPSQFPVLGIERILLRAWVYWTSARVYQTSKQ